MHLPILKNNKNIKKYDLGIIKKMFILKIKIYTLYNLYKR